VSAQPPAQPAKQADTALAAVPTDAFGFVSVKVSKLWDLPAAKPFRDWVGTQKEGAVEAVLGVHPVDVDRITAFLPTADLIDSDCPLMLVSTRKPYNEDKVLKALGAGRLDGYAALRSARRMTKIEGLFRWVVFIDDRTLLFVPMGRSDEGQDKVSLVAQLLVRKTDGPLAAALNEAQNHDLTLGFDVGLFRRLVRERDEELAPFRVLLQAKTATLTIDFDKNAKGKFVLSFPDANTAKRAGPVLEEGIKTLTKYLAEEKDEKPHKAQEKVIEMSVLAWWFVGLQQLVAPAQEKVVMASAVAVLKAAKVTTDDASVIASADVPYADDVAKLAATLPKSLAFARPNVKAVNNLKQLAIGMHATHDSYDRFTGDVFGAGNRPPAWSWRVQILPFIEELQLYNQLDMTKPWDDPANLKKLEAMEMPKIFEHPGRQAPKGHTYFRIFSLPKNAKGTDRPFFKEGEVGPKIAQITDGLSHTFMIVEAGEAVPWYKPDVLAYDGKLPLPQLGDKEADLFLAAMGDGSVRSLRPSKLGEKTLRALITINGAEVIPDLDK
jgi:hypothetical protein